MESTTKQKIRYITEFCNTISIVGDKFESSELDHLNAELDNIILNVNNINRILACKLQSHIYSAIMKLLNKISTNDEWHSSEYCKINSYDDKKFEINYYYGFSDNEPDVRHVDLKIINIDNNVYINANNKLYNGNQITKQSAKITDLSDINSILLRCMLL